MSAKSTKIFSKTSSIKNDLPQLFTLLSGLAGELQAPLKLTALTTYQLVETYKNKNFEYISYADFKQLLQTLEEVGRQLKRCCATTERMMSLHQTRTAIVAPSADVNMVIKNIVNLYKQQIEAAKIRSRLSLSRTLPAAAIGTVEIHQVIHNVLLNAIQAMPSGGVLSIKTKLLEDGRLVGIEVSDQGVGIDPEHLSSIYEPFFSTKARSGEKSTGFGLALVHAILTTFSGAIHIQSSLRQGTKVMITLPVKV